MKVTVCFGHVRVVVPCGAGNFPIRELIDRSIARYRKAIGKPSDYWVCVRSLQSSSDGGILDGDDLLSDVADDREQIVALFEEAGPPPPPPPGTHHHHNGGDGTSASSVGTASPDIFNGGSAGDKSFRPFLRRENSSGGENDVIITQKDLNNGSSLLVRRGSEPALTNLCETQAENNGHALYTIKSSKRWSAIASIDEAKSPRECDEDEAAAADSSPAPPPLPARVGGNGQDATATDSPPSGAASSAATSFSRDSSRHSLANNVQMWKWLEAQERTQEQVELRETDRGDPVGGAGDSVGGASDDGEDDSSAPVEVCIRNTGGPLGIHVVPDYDQNGRDLGLVIQGIEPGGRIHRDGRLAAHDRISRINGTDLTDVDFSKAQEVFKQALQTDEIRLVVRRPRPSDPPQTIKRPTEPPPPLPRHAPPPAKPAAGLSLSLPLSPATPLTPQRPTTPQTLTPATSTPNTSRGDKTTTPGTPQAASPIKKIPPAVPARNPSTSLTAGAGVSPSGGAVVKAAPRLIAPTNTKRIGKKITIDLVKGPAGLGFSVTTRDNAAGGPAPIYIKNILPQGAAIEDGRLKHGDRLLEVNGTEITGLTQSEAVGVLRRVTAGAAVQLVVSRQVIAAAASEDGEDDPFTVPRQLGGSPESETSQKSHDSSQKLAPPEKAGEDVSASDDQKETVTLDIPLNDTGSAGLGVSVKGKTATTAARGHHDLGIFIKSVITGGAASKDGRLRVNDQLMAVNGESLLGRANADAMETLRRAMQQTPGGHIHLVVTRRRASNLVLPPDASREVRISQSDVSRDVRISQSDITDSASSRPIDQSSLKSSSSEQTVNHDRDSEMPPTGGKLRNPALDRLTNGHSSSDNHLRNISYQRATHDSLLDNTLGSETPAKPDAVVTRRPSGAPPPRPRPASTLGFQPAASAGVSAGSRLASRSSDDLLEDDDWGVAVETVADGNNVTLDDPNSPLEPDPAAFQREALGRRSMSEKRKGHSDPKTSEFYQKIKENRDKYYSGVRGGMKRVGSAESLLSSAAATNSLHDKPYHQKSVGDLGPTLGMKKSSSLESLQTAVQEVGSAEDAAAATNATYWRAPNHGLVRGRGCNESFRAAVDRSYSEKQAAGDADPGMHAVEEEDSGSGGHSRQSSFRDEEGGVVRTKSRKGDKGLLKGLGHMFRFGKHRKPLDERGAPQKNPPLPAKVQNNHVEKNNNKPPPLTAEEQEKLQAQYRALQEKQRALERAREAAWLREEETRLDVSGQRRGSDDSRGGQQAAGVSPSASSGSGEMSRADRIQQLRAEHQRRHRERQGVYPLEDEEEKIERQIRNFEIQNNIVREPPPGGHQHNHHGNQPNHHGNMPNHHGNQPNHHGNQPNHLGNVPNHHGNVPNHHGNMPNHHGNQPPRPVSRTPDDERYTDHHMIPPRPQRPAPDPYQRPASRAAGPPAGSDRFSHYANLHEIQEAMRRHDYYQQQYHGAMGRQPRPPYADPDPSGSRLDLRDAPPRGYSDPRSYQDPRNGGKPDYRVDPRDFRSDPRYHADMGVNGRSASESRDPRMMMPPPDRPPPVLRSRTPDPRDYYNYYQQQPPLDPTRPQGSRPPPGQYDRSGGMMASHGEPWPPREREIPPQPGRGGGAFSPYNSAGDTSYPARPTTPGGGGGANNGRPKTPIVPYSTTSASKLGGGAGSKMGSTVSLLPASHANRPPGANLSLLQPYRQQPAAAYGGRDPGYSASYGPHGGYTNSQQQSYGHQMSQQQQQQQQQQRLASDLDQNAGSPYSRRDTNVYAHEPNFGSLPRRRDQPPPSLMSSSAQV